MLTTRGLGPLSLMPTAGLGPFFGTILVPPVTGGPGAQFTVSAGDFQFIPRPGTVRFEPQVNKFAFEARPYVPIKYTVKTATFKFVVPAGQVKFMPTAGGDFKVKMKPR